MFKLVTSNINYKTFTCIYVKIYLINIDIKIQIKEIYKYNILQFQAFCLFGEFTLNIYRIYCLKYILIYATVICLYFITWFSILIFHHFNWFDLILFYFILLYFILFHFILFYFILFLLYLYLIFGIQNKFRSFEISQSP